MTVGDPVSQDHSSCIQTSSVRLKFLVDRYWILQVTCNICLTEGFLFQLACWRLAIIDSLKCFLEVEQVKLFGFSTLYSMGTLSSYCTQYEDITDEYTTSALANTLLVTDIAGCGRTTLKVPEFLIGPLRPPSFQLHWQPGGHGRPLLSRWCWLLHSLYIISWLPPSPPPHPFLPPIRHFQHQHHFIDTCAFVFVLVRQRFLAAFVFCLFSNLVTLKMMI